MTNLNTEFRLSIENHFHQSFNDNIAKEVLLGLSKDQKDLPSKYFYDSKGSKLFEEICHLPEYYLTRTEMDLLKKSAGGIVDGFDAGDLVELGSGANWKIRTLLDHIHPESHNEIRYLPVDVSESALQESAKELIELYPQLQVRGIVADFVHQMNVIPNQRPLLIIFFGSTIGNFNESERADFLRSISAIMKPEDRFLLAFDMIKPKKAMEAAYNDSKGVTSQFNKNILNVLNRELKANFDIQHFDHLAFFDEQHKRVEMHLKANQSISAEIQDLGISVQLNKGETIHTEICRKFSKDCIDKLVHETGFDIDSWFMDSDETFSLVLLKTCF